MKTSKRVLAFGTFDGIHEGHIFFLRQAKLKGDELVVGVARDAHVKEMEEKHPVHSERARLESVKGLKFVDDARLSDRQLGSFDIISEVDPDTIVLGHDQRELEESLTKWLNDQNEYIPMIRFKKL